MQVVQLLDEHLWRTFVEANPRASIFHTPEMHRVFSATTDHQPELWAVVDGESEVLALMTPVHVTLVSGLLRRLTTRSVVYGGALCQDSQRGRAALRQLLEAYTSSTAGQSLFTELRNFHEFSDLRPTIEGCGYAYEDHLNYLIDLNRPSGEILRSMGARTRKHIRRGLRSRQVEIVEITDRAGLVEWYDVLQRTYRNVRVPLADRSLFEAAFDVLCPRGMAVFLSARVAGATVACSIELCYKRTIYGWYGGSDRAYSRYLPSEMLTWHVLEWGARSGYQVYDFGGAGRQNEEYGVRAFKAKFGGDLVSFGRHTYVHAPRLLRLSRLGYSLYRHLL